MESTDTNLELRCAEGLPGEHQTWLGSGEAQHGVRFSTSLPELLDFKPFFLREDRFCGT